jgi:hypothetical protein
MITLEEALNAVDKADLREKTFTTYDKDMMDHCKEQVKKELKKLFEIPINKVV